MAATTILLGVMCVLALVSQGVSIQCFECNVWKAGYGHMCDNRKVKDNCKVCMKIETNSYLMRYSGTPKHSRVVSMVCGNYDITHFGVECHNYRSAEGYSTRCYCDTDLCNGAPSRHTPALTAPVLAAASVVALLHGCT